MKRRGGEIEPPSAVGTPQDVERVYSHVARPRDAASLRRLTRINLSSYSALYY
jgi:hypothetical protein